GPGPDPGERGGRQNAERGGAPARASARGGALRRHLLQPARAGWEGSSARPPPALAAEAEAGRGGLPGRAAQPRVRLAGEVARRAGVCGEAPEVEKGLPDPGGKARTFTGWVDMPYPLAQDRPRFGRRGRARQEGRARQGYVYRGWSAGFQRVPADAGFRGPAN